MKTWHFTLVLALCVLQACSSDSNPDNGGATSDPTAMPNQSEQMADIGTIVSDESVAIPSSITGASTAHVFDYSMQSVSGGLTTARAQLFQPLGDSPSDGFPLVVWAHGTTGISNACAPSLSFDNFGNDVAVNALLDAGYAVLAPDYEGFGTPQIHPYYIRASHANAVISAMAAAHKLSGINISDHWAVVGHSQGGHVAMATARAEQLAPYPLKAVVALAPGSDLQPVSDRAFEAIDAAIANGDITEAGERTFYMNVYSAYIAQALQLVEPTFDPKSIFGDTIAALIDRSKDETSCGSYAQSVNAALTQHVLGGGTLAEFGGLRRDWYDDPIVAARLEIEAFGDESQSMPLLVIQGDADRQIPVAGTTNFVDRQRSLGTQVTYQIISGGRHSTVARSEFGRTIAWLAENFPPK